MTVAYDSDLCARLEAEVREDDARMERGPWSVAKETRKDGRRQWPEVSSEATAGFVINGDCVSYPASLAQCDATADGIARTRNNLTVIADQLAAARREISAKQRGYDALHPMGGGHDDIWSKVDSLIRERDALRSEVERLGQVLADRGIDEPCSDCRPSQMRGRERKTTIPNAKPVSPERFAEIVALCERLQSWDDGDDDCYDGACVKCGETVYLKAPEFERSPLCDSCAQDVACTVTVELLAEVRHLQSAAIERHANMQLMVNAVAALKRAVAKADSISLWNDRAQQPDLKAQRKADAEEVKAARAAIEALDTYCVATPGSCDSDGGELSCAVLCSEMEQLTANHDHQGLEHGGAPTRQGKASEALGDDEGTVAEVTEVKRYFDLDDGDVNYIVVARDLGHAEQIMREAGIEFLDPSVSYDEAKASGALDWSELSDARVMRAKVHRCEGDRPDPVPLAECAMGDWFCSEW